MLNFRLRGYVTCQYLKTVILGNGGTTTLQMEVFTQRNFVADIFRPKLNFIHNKNKKSLSETPWGTYGNVQWRIQRVGHGAMALPNHHR